MYQRPADHNTLIKARARFDRAREQRPVELSSDDRPPIPPVWIDGIDPLHPHAALTRQDHPVEPQASLFDPVGEAEALETASAPGFSVSPHSLSRGNRARSTTITRVPARARMVAAIVPADRHPR